MLPTPPLRPPPPPLPPPPSSPFSSYTSTAAPPRSTCRINCRHARRPRRGRQRALRARKRGRQLEPLARRVGARSAAWPMLVVAHTLMPCEGGAAKRVARGEGEAAVKCGRRAVRPVLHLLERLREQTGRQPAPSDVSGGGGEQTRKEGEGEGDEADSGARAARVASSAAHLPRLPYVLPHSRLKSVTPGSDAQ